MAGFPMKIAFSGLLLLFALWGARAVDLFNNHLRGEEHSMTMGSETAVFDENHRMLLTAEDGTYGKHNIFGYTHIGCFEDNRDNRILSLHVVSDTMTQNECANICGEKWFGVEYGKQCFCGENGIHVDDFVDSDECNIPCFGDDQQSCGGRWKMNVFLKTGGHKGNVKRAESCTGCSSCAKDCNKWTECACVDCQGFMFC